MARFSENRVRRSGLVFSCLAASVFLSLILNPGCARSGPAHRGNSDLAANQSRLPFHPSSDLVSGVDGVFSTIADPKLPASLPFPATVQPCILPTGTLLTVQLAGSLSTATVHAGSPFTAFVAAPFTMDRNLHLDRSMVVTGRVESARIQASPGSVPGSGYFRLTLTAVTIEGREVPLQTSSLFVRGTPDPPESVEVRKGRRLTFRLTAPAMLDASNSVVSAQLREHTVE
jgi:hypothetical protein